MKNLILKDINVGKKGIIIGTIICLVFSVLSLPVPENFNFIKAIGVMIFIFCAVEGVNGYDDQNKTYVIVNSLPIYRDTIVKSKYIEVVLYCIIGEIMSNMVMLAVKLTGFSSKYIKNYFNIYTVILTVALIIIYYAIYNVLYFKFGGYKLRYIKQFIYLLLILAPSLLITTIKKYGNSGIVKYILSLNLKSDSIMLFIIGLISFICSFYISKVIYNKRDL